METYRHAPISAAWSSRDQPASELASLDEAYCKLLEDAAWSAWFADNVTRIEDDPEAPFHYLDVDDRESRRIVVRGDEVSFFEPASDVVAARERGELLPHFISLLEAFYGRYAQRTGRPAPPPSILP